MEPMGEGGYDMRLTRSDGSQEFVEVKTRGRGQELNSNYISDRIDRTTEKFGRYSDNTDLSESNSVLEFNVRRESFSESDSDEILSAVESGIEDTGGDIPISEIRVYVNGEPLEPIVIN